VSSFGPEKDEPWVVVEVKVRAFAKTFELRKSTSGKHGLFQTNSMGQPVLLID
jgi:hypothetical protein